MFYGYVSYSPGTEKVYVITESCETPDAAEAAREAKLNTLPRQVYLASDIRSRGVIKTDLEINIPEGYFGVAV